MKSPILALALAFAPAVLGAQQPAPTTPILPDILTLQDAIAIAQQRGLAADAARNGRDAARARDRAFGARLMPQFALGGRAANYQKGIQPYLGQGGTTQLITTNQNQSDLGLSVSQQLPWTGSRLIVGSQVTRVDNFLP